MTDFITGCTHFGHANIIKLADRPFADVEEMDRVLIENWNRVVKTQDTVYHLGDFAFRSVANVADYLNQLNGRIVQLQGNHDPIGWGLPYKTVKVDRRKIVLFHYPIEEWDGWYRDSIHFHCHQHKSEFVSGLRRGNVTVEATDYTPIRLEDAISRVLQAHWPTPADAIPL